MALYEMEDAKERVILVGVQEMMRSRRKNP